MRCCSSQPDYRLSFKADERETTLASVTTDRWRSHTPRSHFTSWNSEWTCTHAFFFFFFFQTHTLLRFCCVSAVSLREGDEWFGDSLWWLSSPAETSSHFHFCCFFAHFPTHRRWHNDYCHQQDCLAIRNNARPIFFLSLSCYNLIYAGVQGSEVNFNIRLSFVVFVFWGSYCTLLFALLHSSFCPFKVTRSCDGLHSTSPPLYYTVTPSETSPLIKSGLCQPPSHALAPHLPTTPATRALLRLKLSPELHPANEHCQVTGEGLGGGLGAVHLPASF